MIACDAPMKHHLIQRTGHQIFPISFIILKQDNIHYFSNKTLESLKAIPIWYVIIWRFLFIILNDDYYELNFSQMFSWFSFFEKLYWKLYGSDRKDKWDMWNGQEICCAKFLVDKKKIVSNNADVTTSWNWVDSNPFLSVEYICGDFSVQFTYVFVLLLFSVVVSRLSCARRLHHNRLHVISFVLFWFNSKRNIYKIVIPEQLERLELLEQQMPPVPLVRP